MAAEDSWVFDSLICFLHGPIWNAPLQTFIEEKSLLFDPNLQPDEKNAEVVKIHEEYKHLVDYMLGSFMEEMQITPEQFEMACIEGGGGGGGVAAAKNKDNADAQHSFHFHQGLFQQIWAANDIKIFIRMMTQRNIELQLQALDLIEKNQLSLLQESEALDNNASPSKEVSGIYGADVEDFIKNSLMEREFESPEATLTPEHDLATQEEQVADKFERLHLFFEQSPQVDAEDMTARQEYLRQQRDKIVEIKRKTRAKQLQETVARQSARSAAADDAATQRPSSAMVAQRLLENDGKKLLEQQNAGGDGSNEKKTVEINSALQLRKTLAKRLRTEVVEQPQ